VGGEGGWRPSTERTDEGHRSEDGEIGL
jgi:hypothetical protein